ncbi:hypothetical protein A2334_05575 [Candidatus Roizmanbacteria bacterium RIFOXYB2_FULL_38_10]|uniref:O-antigen ligase-related domain-containing protein n=1 Tax=Candidatus Roizmanbacteria bacterium RIFOXYD1_FULL_38_12 TaxID=1802093 RepID=A0A1F7L0L5_9BACT|nr:MAG: hypothetical protein A3K47_02695 [Candidatus Roizmanbacteria bacterium RIFOXYA2_FULL_38_14]OGK63677.1 MAG: hypothetical protein A3K27_02695 [Candidatus Roizmanbacteria bacterium RIFOXYA1_FULL_37_12]OGK65523.1 MAG: hypothetical protein A3K38_02695 [Candidatus Roizmanbacteria bacterium RIFOXYB1_FULL_40_23]OGK68307.1 MAG: hypothetical protein A2334_05575 [Candidatus Roizmanbacteria bacterium RIFOXYB2_FULL_38_10]OGK69928.1 MAG: hypothetical protein A3K21_02700 [Candidatus Roizmanbacteria ba
MRTLQKYLYYFLFFVTPLVMFSGTSELFEFNKMITIYIVVTAILSVWCVRMIQTGKFYIRRTPFDIFIGLFFISQVISTIFSIDLHTSIFGYYGRFNGGLLSQVTYFLLYYSFITFLDEEEGKMQTILGLLKVTLISSAIVILWGLPGRIDKDLSCLIFTGKWDNSCWTSQFDPAARMFSTLGQPNWLGAYLGITFFITIYFYLTSIKRNTNLLSFSFSILTLIAIFFTNSRSSIISVYVSFLLLLMWIIYWRKHLHLFFLKKKLGILIISMMLLIPICKTGISSIDRFFAFSTYQNYFKKAPPAKTSEGENKITKAAPSKISDSLDIRKVVWKGAINLGSQYPLFGTGVETFAYSYYFVRPIEHNLTSEWDYLYNKAHNEYLNFYATTGILGVGTYLLFIFAIVLLGLYWIIRSTTAKKQANPQTPFLQIILLASWSTILVTNFFGFSTTVINLYFYTIPAILYYLELTKNQTKDSLKGSQALPNTQGNILAGIGFVALIGLFLLQFFVTYWIADTKYAMAENHAKANDYQSATSLLTRALELHKEHVYEDKLSYYLANLAFIASYQKDTRLADELLNASEQYNKSSLNASSQNILYLKTRIKNQYLFYQISLNKQYLINGIQTLSEAQKIAPTDAKIPYFLSTYYSLLYDEEKDSIEKFKLQNKSLKTIEESIRLKNDYFESHYLKAQLLAKYHKKEEAKKIYEFILKNISPNNIQVQNELEKL